MSNNIFLNNNLDEQLLNKIFFTLINEDKWDTLFEILSLKVIDVNTKDFRGRNALFWAINKGNIVAIEKLMQLNISTEVSPNLSAINYRIFYIFSVAQPAYPLITSGCISGEGLFFLNKGRECVRNPRQK